MAEKSDNTGCLTNKYISNAQVVNDLVKEKEELKNQNNLLKENKEYKKEDNKIKDVENKINKKEENGNENKVVKKENDITFKELKGAKFHQGPSFKNGAPHWIVVHYTAMAGVGAQKCTESFAKTTKSVSTHFFCDSKEVYRVVDEKHVAWHVCGGQVEQPIKNKKLTNEELVEYGDKYNWRFKLAAENHIEWKKNKDDFTGNYDSLSVDICCIKGSKKTNSVVDQDWNFNPKAVINAAKTVAYLCKKHNIDLDHVIRHGDATGKPCLPVDKTEIYTPDGYRKLLDLRVGDSVFQYNPNKNEIEESRVISVIKPYVATICKNRGYEATFNHRTLYRDLDGTVKTDRLENILGKEVYLFTSTNNRVFYPNYKLGTESLFYNGVVSCIEVPSGYIVIKQNGTVFITGNCPRPFVSLPGDSDNTLNDKRWEDFKQMVAEYL